MPIARPDTRRRREPAGPGRCFGPCTPTSITITRPRLALLALALAWALCVTATAAAEGDGPIVLTNEDVARLHAPPGGADDTGGRDTETVAPPAAMGEAAESGDPEALAELEKDLRSRLDRISRQSMGSVANALDTRLADTSQQQLRARATRAPDAPSGPAAPTPGPVDAQVPAADSNAEVAEEDVPRYLVPTPACVYGTRNQLLFQPEGSTCPAVRARSQRTFESGESAARVTDERESGRVGCVYGSRGQLLYSSKGVDCPDVEDPS